MRIRGSVLAITIAGIGCAPEAVPPRGAEPLPVRPAKPVIAAAGVADDAVHVAGFSFSVRARPFGNLTHHLDCLSAEIPCSDKAIHSLWDPGWTPEDGAALSEWRSVRDAYKVSAELLVPPPAGPLPLPLPNASLDFERNMRVAGLLSSTIDDYRRNLAVLLPPPDAERLTRAALHFWPRFDAFWQRAGAAEGARFRAGFEALLRTGNLPEILARAARFYGSALGADASIDFDVIVLPVTSRHPGAERILAHGIVEVAGADRPEERMDVLCHEIFHYFYASRTPAQQAALVQGFLGTNDPLAEVAYSIVDESVATALGNGVVGQLVAPADHAKRLARDKGFYSVHAIDATAKGLLARTHDDPTLGQPLDSPDVVAKLIAATRDAVGPDPAPSAFMFALEATSDAGPWAATVQAILDRAHTTHSESSTPIDGPDSVAKVTLHPALPALLLVARDRIKALSAYGDVIPAAARAAIAGESKRKGAFAFAVRRSTFAWMFIVVADTPEDAQKVTFALMDSTSVKAGAFRLPE